MDSVDRIFEIVDKKYSEQRLFASDVGVPASRISEWRSRRSTSYLKYLPRIAEVLGTTSEYLLTGRHLSLDKQIENAKKKCDEQIKAKQAVIPKDDSLSAEFARLFDTLTPEHKNEIIAEMLKRQRDE